MLFVLFCDLLKVSGESGNPKPEHEWPSEEDWKEWYPSVFSHSSNESQPKKQQVGNQLCQKKVCFFFTFSGVHIS